MSIASTWQERWARLGGNPRELLELANALPNYVRVLIEDNAISSEFEDELSSLMTASQGLAAYIDSLTGRSTLTTASLRAFRHDCLNELNIVEGYTELLLDALATRSEDKWRDQAFGHLRKIEEDAERLRRRLDVLATQMQHFGASDRSATDDSPDSVTASPQPPMPHHSSTMLGEQPEQPARLLVVDDDESIRALLERRLANLGYRVELASNGGAALTKLRAERFDLVMLDIVMPEMNGYQVLAAMKSDTQLRHVPVIMVTAFDDTDDVERCIELGADEYLTKTFSPQLLNARISACLAKQRMRERERQYIEQLGLEREKMKALLRNVLPQTVAEQFEIGTKPLAQLHPDVTVLFAELVNFDRLTSLDSPQAAVERLDTIFARFGDIAVQRNLATIKTVGDTYILAGGGPTPKASHVDEVAEAALEMMAAVHDVAGASELPMKARIGLHTGPVVGGLLRRSRFSYDLWGGTVKHASRLKRASQAGRILISAAVADRLSDRFVVEPRARVGGRGKPGIGTFYLVGRQQ